MGVQAACEPGQANAMLDVMCTGAQFKQFVVVQRICLPSYCMCFVPWVLGCQANTMLGIVRSDALLVLI